MDRDSALAQLQSISTDAAAVLALKRDELQSKQREYDRSMLQLENAMTARNQIEEKWNLDLSSNESIDFVSPDICPTCKQPLSDSGVGHSHEEMERIARHEIDGVVESLAAAEAAMAEATAERDLAASQVTLADKTAKDAMMELEHVQSTWADRIINVETELTSARNEQARLTAQITSATKVLQLDTIIRSKEAAIWEEQKAVEANQSAYRDLCISLQESETRLQELRASGEAQRSLSATMTNLVNVFGPRGVQTFLLQNAINTLQTISQVYLDELSDGSQRLELTLDAGDRISRRAFISGSDGNFMERPLASLSGGQWRRCSLALSLGFADLASRKGRIKSSLCVLDEPLTHLDRSGRDCVGRLLRSLLQNGNNSPLSGGMTVSTILVILQDLAAEELEESFDHIDQVVKANGVSTVEIDQ